MVRSRALQRGHGAVAQHPEVRAEALDYEPHFQRFMAPMPNENGVEATHKPVDTGSPLILILSPEAGERKYRSPTATLECALLSPPGRGWVRGIRFMGSIRDKFVVESPPSAPKGRDLAKGGRGERKCSRTHVAGIPPVGLDAGGCAVPSDSGSILLATNLRFSLMLLGISVILPW